MTEILHHLSHAALHTLQHTWYMLPVLFTVYLLIEFLEHKAMDKVRAVLSDKRFGIVGGALLGLFPQCGFSVAAANLYSERLITAGAVAAVFVATSDEAFPILLSNPDSLKWFLPMLVIKLFFAVFVGFCVNAVFKLTKLDRAVFHESHHHSEHTHEGGEHHHCSHCDSNRGIISAAVHRTLSIFAFVIVIGFVIHFIIDIAGEEKLNAILMTDSIFQPFAAALVGLIPSCAASVVTTELFVTGSLGFGSLASALCAASGVGLMVLFRVNRNIKQNLAIVGVIYVMSSVLGVILELII